MTDKYTASMLVGNRFSQKYINDETEDWNGCIECATVAELTVNLMFTLMISMETALGYVMKNVMENGFRNKFDHGYDEYARGFLAGQILGLPTKENLEKAERAEILWSCDDGDEYGYYQEVLEEVR